MSYKDKETNCCCYLELRGNMKREIPRSHHGLYASVVVLYVTTDGIVGKQDGWRHVRVALHRTTHKNSVIHQHHHQHRHRREMVWSLSVHLCLCPARADSSKPTAAACRFAAVGSASRRYRLIAAAEACCRHMRAVTRQQTQEAEHRLVKSKPSCATLEHKQMEKIKQKGFKH